MKQTTLIYIMIFLLVSAIFSCLLPYPIFSNYNNITEKNAYDINNYNEIEMQSSSTQNATILDLQWSNEIDLLLPINREFEIIDIETEESFQVIRIGGKNHADVEPKNQEDLEAMREIYHNGWSWTRRPVLVQLNENAFLPASLAGYPHGYTENNTDLTGHFCLHFKNSKTHGTNRIDDEHQKQISHAEETGKDLLNKEH